MPSFELDAQWLDVLRAEAAGDTPLPPVVAVGGLQFFYDDREQHIAKHLETFVERQIVDRHHISTYAIALG